MCRGFTGALGRRHDGCLQIIKDGKRKKKNLNRQELTDYCITDAESLAASCELRLAPERIMLQRFSQKLICCTTGNKQKQRKVIKHPGLLPK